MKRGFVLLMAVVLGLAFLPCALGQEEGGGGNMAARGPMMERMGNTGMGGMMGKMRDMGPVTTPEELAGYDAKTKAAWNEIQDVNIKKRVNIYLALSAAFAIGVAAFGGVLAQGRVASAAMEGIARNPEASSKIFSPLIISLALIESLVIYALVVAFILSGKM